ncbi:Protein of unknown function, putative, partial [Plasmodium vivax]
LDIKFKHDGTCNASSNRLLAKREIQKNIKYKSHRENLHDNIMNKNIKNGNDKPTYKYLKKGLNDLESYKKDYSRRYATKKGLAKLDCYYEKKVFDKIDHIYELAGKFQNDEKGFKKKIYNIFGYRLILFTLLPTLGLIFPVLFYGERNAIIPWCGSGNHPNEGSTQCTITLLLNKGELIAYHCLNVTISCILLIMVLSAIAYLITKVIKYERIKAGKGKNEGKVNYRYCKNIFI